MRGKDTILLDTDGDFFSRDLYLAWSQPTSVDSVEALGIRENVKREGWLTGAKPIRFIIIALGATPPGVVDFSSLAGGTRRSCAGIVRAES